MIATFVTPCRRLCYSSAIKLSPLVANIASPQRVGAWEWTRFIANGAQNISLPCCRQTRTRSITTAAGCCPSGSWPALVAPEAYAANGSEETLGDLLIYVSGSPAGKGIIVYPEVFGFSGRLRGICDTLAAEGYFVVMGEFHRGDTAIGKDSIPAWVKACEEAKPVVADTQAVIDYMTGKGVTSVGAIGFCWGAWAFCRASAAGIPIKCGVSPHPSIKLEEFAFGLSQIELLRKVEMPILLLTAGNDPGNVKPGGELVTINAAKGGEAFVYPEMLHGWASRGDVSDPAVARDVEDTFKKAIAFFAKFL